MVAHSVPGNLQSMQLWTSPMPAAVDFHHHHNDFGLVDFAAVVRRDLRGQQAVRRVRWGGQCVVHVHERGQLVA